jgi:hypothetical protein
MIAWRYIITDFYRLQYDEEALPFNEVQAYSIFTRTLERYTMLVMAKAQYVRAIYQARQRRDNSPSNRLIQRTNKIMGPLFEPDEEGRLTKSLTMAKRLKLARLEHVGKNIPVTSQ